MFSWLTDFLGERFFLAHGLNGRIRGWNIIHLDDYFLRVAFLRTVFWRTD